MLIEIDCERILHNISQIKLRIGGVKFCAIVKADAYGHGILRVSKEIEKEVDFFAVARAGEGILLRNAGISKPVLVLNPLRDNELSDALNCDLSLTVDDLKQAELISQLSIRFKKTTDIHIKTDTGMNRLGIKNQADLVRLCTAIKNLPGVNCQGVYSHLASTVFKDRDFTERQLEVFRTYAETVRKYFPGAICHFANTSAALSLPEARFDMVRVGIGMYGYCDRPDIRLQPAKSAKCFVVETKTVKAGESIGYDRTFVAKKNMPVAVLGCGYGDGYLRNFGKNGKVLTDFGFKRILGTVCMDLIVVENPGGRLKRGDEVVLLGENKRKCLWANDIFENCGTIVYETLCNLRMR